MDGRLISRGEFQTSRSTKRKPPPNKNFLAASWKFRGNGLERNRAEKLVEQRPGPNRNLSGGWAEMANIRRLICAQCAGEYEIPEGRIDEFFGCCSRSCRDDLRAGVKLALRRPWRARSLPTPARPCAHCNTPFEGRANKRFCSEHCRHTAKDRARGRAAINRQAGECTADGCSDPALTKGLCNKHYQRQRAGKPLVVDCELCGKRTGRPRFCSQRCAQLKREREIFGRIPQHRTCLECGTDFEGIHPQNQYCSTECSRRVNNRRSSAMRRARLLEATREYFDPVDVLKRDNWRCHICGTKTPKRLRGTTDPRAPELDHIIPLAAGGEHSPRNTACACRGCNIAKSDKPLGQLRLVA